MMILLGETWLIERNNMSFKELRELPDLGTDLIVNTYGEMDCDTVTTGLGCWIGVLEAVGCPCETAKKGAPIEVKPSLRLDQLGEDVAKLDRGKIPDILKNHELIQKIMEQTRNIKKAVGDSKFVCGQMVGPFSGASMMVDVKEFMILVGKKSPHLGPLLEYTSDFFSQLANLYIENGADIVQTCDPCSSGDMISPKSYDQYVLPTLKQMKAGFKNHPKTMIHICGKAGMRQPRIKEVGFDGFSVDFPVDMKQVFTDAEGKLTMIGNFDPNGIMRLGKPEEVYEAAKERLQAAAEVKAGYILMPGCDLAATTPMANIQAMVRASKDFAGQA